MYFEVSSFLVCWSFPWVFAVFKGAFGWFSRPHPCPGPTFSLQGWESTWGKSWMRFVPSLQLPVLKNSAEFDVMHNVLCADCFFSCVLLCCMYLDLALQIFFWNVLLRSASQTFQAQNSSSFNVLWFNFRSITVLPLLFEDTWKIHWFCPFSFKISVANITIWCDPSNCGLGLRKNNIWHMLKLQAERFRMDSVGKTFIILTHTGSGFGFAQGFLFYEQLILTQGDSRVWKSGTVLSWRAFRRADHPGQGMCGIK